MNCCSCTKAPRKYSSSGKGGSWGGSAREGVGNGAEPCEVGPPCGSTFSARRKAPLQQWPSSIIYGGVLSLQPCRPMLLRNDTRGEGMVRGSMWCEVGEGARCVHCFPCISILCAVQPGTVSLRQTVWILQCEGGQKEV